MEAGAVGRVKGTLLTNLRNYIVATHGAAEWQAVVAALAQADRQVLGAGLIVAGWYPVGTWNRTVEVYLARHSAQRDEAIVQVARHIADEDLNVLFKLLLKLGSPEFLLNRVASIYARYFDRGTVEVLAREPRNWRIALSAPLEEDHGLGRTTCGGIVGWLEEAFRLVRVVPREIRHTPCRFDGAPRCEYTIRW